MKLENLNIKSIVEETIINLYDKFSEKQTVPDIQMSKEIVSIKADESATKRVIENLIFNAIKYSYRNIAIILEKSKTTVNLTISNDVENLTEKDVELFFDRFYMADQTRTGKGTGLGLSIAKSLMYKMNGQLSAELKDAISAYSYHPSATTYLETVTFMLRVEMPININYSIFSNSV